MEEACDPARLAAANIRPHTRLATDYLNHFNEAAMLVEMLEAMPEAAEDVLAWRPARYDAHFAASGFAHKELAVAAYRSADPAVRASLDAAADAFADLMAQVQARLAAGGDATSGAAALRARLAAIAAIIEGGPGPSGQDAIDALFA